jgi:hypothetical protein
MTLDNDSQPGSGRPRMMPPLWLMGLLVLMCAAVIVWRIPPLMRAIEEREKLGPDATFSNGFKLTPDLRSDPTLTRFGAPEEVIPIDEPPIWDTDTVDDLGKNFRTRFLISTSEVIGVVIDGKARAYPLRILQWHEVVNDVFGGIPICVVHHPISETTTVFRRPISDNSEPLMFGSSGLVVDCCMLIHERLGPGGRPRESLWSPTDGKVISGDRAGEWLDLIPFQLTSWNKWRQSHPETDVLGMVESHRRYYKKEPYSTYRLVDRPLYPHDPRPPEGDRANLSRVVVTRQDGRWSARIPTDPTSIQPAGSPLDPVGHVITSWFAIHAREIPLLDP